jgi:hypothetical protein
MAKTHPRRYKWVKDNPNVSHNNESFDKQLAEPIGYLTTPNGYDATPVYDDDYLDFKKHLYEIDAIRKALANRDRWAEQSLQRYNSGKK